MANEYGYDEEEWEYFPDETRDQIIAEHDAALASVDGEASCGCMGFAPKQLSLFDVAADGSFNNYYTDRVD